mmetsp:Transcript_3208/g.7069  ORF Transcript_3208/g.7069 Transcript_3208/m.7069 type:complete len:89 (+) Transcript_3208:368-634(+)
MSAATGTTTYNFGHHTPALHHRRQLQILFTIRSPFRETAHAACYFVDDLWLLCENESSKAFCSVGGIPMTRRVLSAVSGGDRTANDLP